MTNPPVRNEDEPGDGDRRRSSGPIRVAERAEAVPNMVRAGRPRIRVGILHTINREHGLHPALESGRAPVSALKYHSPLEGESERRRSLPSIRWGANAGAP